MNAKLHKRSSTVLYDGDCVLCSRFMQFVIKKSESNQFRFVAFPREIDSDQSAQLSPSTIILIEGDAFFYRSTAAIKIVSQLAGFWKWTKILFFIPAPIRDFFYMLVSRNRYKLFGRTKSCIIADSDNTDASFNPQIFK